MVDNHRKIVHHRNWIFEDRLIDTLQNCLLLTVIEVKCVIDVARPVRARFLQAAINLKLSCDEGYVVHTGIIQQMKRVVEKGKEKCLAHDIIRV